MSGHHHGQYVPPDPSKGDDRTVGGYRAVHSRPAALEGRDGFSYSIEVATDSLDDGSGRFGAYLMFVQWSRLGAQKVDGHLETGFLVHGASADAVERELGAMPLTDAQRELDALIRARDGDSTRRWWNAIDDKEAP